MRTDPAPPAPGGPARDRSRRSARGAALAWRLLLAYGMVVGAVAAAAGLAGLPWWAAMGGGLAATAGLSWAVGRRVAADLRRLADAALAVAGGNLDKTLDLDATGEIGEMAKAVDALREGARERGVMEDALGRFVHSQLVSTLRTDPLALEPGGVLRTVTVLSSDLRGFTALAERTPPDRLIEVLNAYLGRMADVVDRHGGTVNEFIGDAVLALFGAREGDAHDPLRAVACAAEMQVELARFNAERPDQPALHMGVGLATGSVIVGNIGSERRMKFGVVGDTVNLCARVESFTTGGEVLLAEPTYEAVRHAVVARGPQEVAAKGKAGTLRMWSLESVGPPFDLHVPGAGAADAPLPAVDLPAYVFRVAGKQVANVPFEARVTALSALSAEVRCRGGLVRAWDDVKLLLVPADGPPVDEVYGKVVAGDGEGAPLRVRFTSVPDPEALARLAPDEPAPAPAPSAG